MCRFLRSREIEDKRAGKGETLRVRTLNWRTSWQRTTFPGNGAIARVQLLKPSQWGYLRLYFANANMFKRDIF